MRHRNTLYKAHVDRCSLANNQQHPAHCSPANNRQHPARYSLANNRQRPARKCARFVGQPVSSCEIKIWHRLSYSAPTIGCASSMTQPVNQDYFDPIGLLQVS